MKWMIIIVGLLFMNNCWSIEHSHELYQSQKYNRSYGKDSGSLFIEYCPNLQIDIFDSGDVSFDGFIELKARGEHFIKSDKDKTDLDLNLYRFWLRSSAEQSEFRIGLQKINFGPAYYIRSLQWFDRIDTLDPRKNTDGVWGMLFRYYTPDNSNVWFWALYDEHGLKGQEILESREETVEMGGRIQLPILAGDMGFSFHN